jgi:hypothetical protein
VALGRTTEDSAADFLPGCLIDIYSQHSLGGGLDGLLLFRRLEEERRASAIISVKISALASERKWGSILTPAPAPA